MKQQPSEEDEERREWREKMDKGDLPPEMDKGDLPPSDERPASAILARQWSVQTWNGLAALGQRGSTFLPSASEPSRTAMTRTNMELS